MATKLSSAELQMLGLTDNSNAKHTARTDVVYNSTFSVQDVAYGDLVSFLWKYMGTGRSVITYGIVDGLDTARGKVSVSYAYTDGSWGGCIVDADKLHVIKDADSAEYKMARAMALTYCEREEDSVATGGHTIMGDIDVIKRLHAYILAEK